MARRLTQLSPHPVLLTGIKENGDTPLTAPGWIQSGNGFYPAPGRWVLIPIRGTVASWRDGGPMVSEQTFVTTEGNRIFVIFRGEIPEGTPIQVLAIPC